MSYKSPLSQKNYNPCANLPFSRTSPPISRQYPPKTKPDKDNLNDIPIKVTQANYNRELNALKEDIEMRDRENSDLVTKKIQMENDLNIQIQALQKQNSVLDSNIKAQELQLSQFYSKVSNQLSRPISSLRDVLSGISDLLAENAGLQNKIEKLHEQSANYDSDIELLRQKILADKEEKSALKKTIQSLKQSQKNVPDVNSIIIPYEKKIEILSQKVNDLQQKYEESQRIVFDHENSVSTLKGTIDRLQKTQTPTQLPDSTKQLYESKINLLQERLTLAEKDSQQKEQESKRLNEVVADREAKIAELESKNEILQNEITENEFKSQQSNDKVADLKKKLNQANEMVASINLELDTSNAKSRELEVRLAKLLQEKMALESQVSEQNSGQNSVNQHLESENQALTQSLEELEQALSKQREEIANLTKSRLILIKNLENAQILIKKHEDIVETALNLRAKAEEARDNYIKQANAEREVEERAFNDAFDHVLDILPVSIVDQVSKLNGLPKAEIFRSTVDTIMTEAKNLNASSQQSDEYQQLSKRHQALIEQLQYCVEFLRKVSRSQINVMGQDGRTEILQQCARIGKFIDEQDLYLPTKQFSKISIFDPLQMNDPEKIAKLFFEFVDESMIDQSPIVELYTLFCILAQVNVSLSDAAETAINLSNELKDAKAYSKSLIQQLDEQTHNEQELNELKGKISYLFDKILELPTGDFDVDFANFTDVLTNGLTSSRKVRDLERQLNEFRNRVEITEDQNSHERLSYETEREEFCKRVNKVIATLENELVNARKKFTEQLHNVEEEDEKLKTRIEELELENAELSKISENSEIVDQANQEKMGILLAKLEKVSAEKRALELELENIKNENNKLIKTARDDVAKLVEKLNNEKAKVAAYKARAIAAEDKNSDVISEVRKRTDALASQYGTSIVSLQNDMATLRAKTDTLAREKENISNENSRLSMELAKLRVANKSLQIACDDMKTALEMERANASAKVSSVQISAGSKLETQTKLAQENRQKFRNSMVKMANADSKVLEYDDDRLIDECSRLVSEVVNSEAAKVTQDALHLRKALRIDGTDKQLSDVFSEMRTKIARLDDRCAATQSDNQRVNQILERLQRDNERLSQSQAELSEWSRWGRSLFRQVSEVSPNGHKDCDVRLTIEEQFLGSLGFATLRSKLAILRGEKQFLLSYNIPGVSDRRPDSIRPVAMVVVFANIVQGLSGNLAPKILIKEKKNE